jgi:hypothetical protein
VYTQQPELGDLGGIQVSNEASSKQQTGHSNRPSPIGNPL